jgi:hypothetical protein
VWAACSRAGSPCECRTEFDRSWPCAVPFIGLPATSGYRVEPVLGVWSSVDVRKLANETMRPLPVPTTTLFIRNDGLVNWHACLDTACPENNIEISGPHVLIARKTQVMRILAEQLGRCSMSFPA